MQKYINSVTDRSGNAIANAQVKVLTYPGGALATIYSDQGVTQTANPLTTDANGAFSFYAANGQYTLSITAPNISGTLLVSDVFLQDIVSGAVNFANGITLGAGTDILAVYSRRNLSLSDGSGAGLGLTFNFQREVRVGNLVFVDVSVTYPSTVNSNGANINGFTQAQQQAELTTMSSVVAGCIFGISGTHATAKNTSGGSTIFNSDLSGLTVIFSGCYEAA